MRTLSIFAVALLSAAVAAQPEIEVYPGTTDFTSRGSSGSGTGETLQGFHSSHWRGIGDNGTQCEITGVRLLLQDQNRTTSETYHVSFRTGTDVTGPLTGTGPQTRLGPFTIPTAAGTGGAVAYRLSTTFTSPVVVPCEGHFSAGVEWGTALTWTADGGSMHMSRGEGTFQQTRMSAKLGAEDHAWQIIGSATSATHPSLERTWRVALLTANPTLQLGNGGTIYGKGGQFPEIGKPFSARVRGGASMSGATSNLFLIFPGVPLPGGVNLGLGARLFYGGIPLSLGTATASTTGEATHNIVASVPAAQFPPIPIVAVMATTSGPALASNHALVEGK